MEKYLDIQNKTKQIFHIVNQHYFDGILDMPNIYVAPCKNAYAHYRAQETYLQVRDTNNKQNAPTGLFCTRYEVSVKTVLNISTGLFLAPFDVIVSMILHEMIHIYNDIILNVQDTSRNGTYHNALFALSCETHGLICEKTNAHGYAHTTLKDSALCFILSNNDMQEIANGCTAIVSKDNNYMRYACPCCHTVVRTTNPAHLICADCGAELTAL